ncbi:MAG: lauroyl acyltransferase [Hyphomicrobiales bacterium]|nr:MAG: lauroyl acyltransferase [Hyphomicrobiales bacterium]
MSLIQIPIHKKIQNHIELGLLKLIRLLLVAMPLEVASGFMGKIWRLVAPRLKRHNRAIANITSAFPEKTTVECEHHVMDMWENLGRTFAEGFFLNKLIAQHERFEINIEEMQAASRKLKIKGGVFVSCHSGNWELIGYPGLVHDIELGGVYQKIKNPLVDDYFVHQRKNLWPVGLHAKGQQAARALLKIVKSGKCVGILADLRDLRGIEVPFFHKSAPSNPFPAMLARTQNVPLFAARCVRLPGVRFRFDIIELPVAQTDDRKRDIETTTATIQKQIETWIREEPDQWMWGHRRWSR